LIFTEQRSSVCSARSALTYRDQCKLLIWCVEPCLLHTADTTFGLRPNLQLWVPSFFFGMNI
jgi:hypothetical protein